MKHLKIRDKFESAYDTLERATWAGIIIVATLLAVIHAWGL